MIYFCKNKHISKEIYIYIYNKLLITSLEGSVIVAGGRAGVRSCRIVEIEIEILPG